LISIHDKLIGNERRIYREFKNRADCKVDFDDYDSNLVYDLELIIDQYDLQIRLKGRVVSEIICAIIHDSSDQHLKALAGAFNAKIKSRESASQ